MAKLVTDAEARLAFETDRMDEVWGTPIPTDAWVGPGLLDEVRDGRGADDDGQQPR